MLAPFWSLPFCFFLLCLACFPPSGLRACWLARFWLLVACVVLSGSFLAVSGLYLLGRVSLAVACLLCPVWLVSVAVCASYLLGWASLAVTCLRCPLWLVSCRLLFVPAWWGVSGCCLPVLPCPARFRPSAVPTCLAGRFWLLICLALSCLSPFPPSLVYTYLVAYFWPSAVRWLHFLGFCGFCDAASLPAS